MTTEGQEKALLELTLKRRQIRRSLVAWSSYRHPTEVPALHHRYLLDRLQAVVEGKLVHPKTGKPCRRLMVLMPPGSAKSTYISVDFPCWYLANFPGNRILGCSFAVDLMESFSRQCRNIVEQEHKTLGYNLSADSRSVNEWHTTKGGTFKCAGVGGGLSGRRADLGFIDDYLANEEDANSQVVREKQYAWYRSDFVPRLKPNAIRIIVANRRHEDDLVGRLQDGFEKDGVFHESEKDEWVIIKLPMLAEDNDPLDRKVGERLWPEYFTQEMVNEAQKNARTWAGLYQQRPAPEEGDYFKKDWLVGYTPAMLSDIEKQGLRYYCASDHALKEGESNDRNVILAAGVDSSGRIWILPDWFWDRCKTDELVEQMLAMAKRRKPIRWFAGADHITGSIGPFLYKRMTETGTFFPLEELTAKRDLQARAQSIAGRMGAKMVMFPKYVPGWDKFEHELLTFPAGTHDDVVAALAELGRGLSSMFSPEPKKNELPEILQPGWRPTVGWVLRSDAKRKEEERLALIDN